MAVVFLVLLLSQNTLAFCVSWSCIKTGYSNTVEYINCVRTDSAQEGAVLAVISCTANKAWQLLLSFITGVAKAMVEGLMAAFEYMLTINPCFYNGGIGGIGCTDLFGQQVQPRPMVLVLVGTLIMVLYPIYVVLLLLAGFSFIISADDPQQRNMAKERFYKLVISMILVSLSPVIFQLFLNLEVALVEAVFGMISAEVNNMTALSGVTIFATIAMIIGASFVQTSIGATFALIVIAVIVVMGIRYLMTTVLGCMFPVTLFCYFWEPTRNFGRGFVTKTMMWIFIPVVQSVFLALTIISLMSIGGGGAASINKIKSNAVSGSITEILIPMTMIGAGLIGMIVSPFVMSGMLQYIGGAVAATGMGMSTKEGATKVQRVKGFGLMVGGASLMGQGVGPSAQYAASTAAYLQSSFGQSDESANLLPSSWSGFKQEVRDVGTSIGRGASRVRRGGNFFSATPPRAGGAAWGTPWQGRFRAPFRQATAPVVGMLDSLSQDSVNQQEALRMVGKNRGGTAEEGEGFEGTSLAERNTPPKSPMWKFWAPGTPEGGYSDMYNTVDQENRMKGEGNLPLFMFPWEWSKRGQSLGTASTRLAEALAGREAVVEGKGGKALSGGERWMRAGASLGHLALAFKPVSPLYPIRHMGRILYDIAVELAPPTGPLWLMVPPRPIQPWKDSDSRWKRGLGKFIYGATTVAHYGARPFMPLALLPTQERLHSAGLFLSGLGFRQVYNGIEWKRQCKGHEAEWKRAHSDYEAAKASGDSAGMAAAQTRKDDAAAKYASLMVKVGGQGGSKGTRFMGEDVKNPAFHRQEEERISESNPAFYEHYLRTARLSSKPMKEVDEAIAAGGKSAKNAFVTRAIDELLEERGFSTKGLSSGAAARARAAAVAEFTVEDKRRIAEEAYLMASASTATEGKFVPTKQERQEYRETQARNGLNLFEWDSGNTEMQVLAYGVLEGKWRQIALANETLLVNNSENPMQSIYHEAYYRELVAAIKATGTDARLKLGALPESPSEAMYEAVGGWRKELSEGDQQKARAAHDKAMAAVEGIARGVLSESEIKACEQRAAEQAKVTNIPLRRGSQGRIYARLDYVAYVQQLGKYNGEANEMDELGVGMRAGYRMRKLTDDELRGETAIPMISRGRSAHIIYRDDGAYVIEMYHNADAVDPGLGQWMHPGGAIGPAGNFTRVGNEPLEEAEVVNKTAERRAKVFDHYEGVEKDLVGFDVSADGQLVALTSDGKRVELSGDSYLVDQSLFAQATNGGLSSQEADIALRDYMHRLKQQGVPDDDAMMRSMQNTRLRRALMTDGVSDDVARDFARVPMTRAPPGGVQREEELFNFAAIHAGDYNPQTRQNTRLTAEQYMTGENAKKVFTSMREAGKRRVQEKDLATADAERQAQERHRQAAGRVQIDGEELLRHPPVIYDPNNSEHVRLYGRPYDPVKNPDGKRAGERLEPLRYDPTNPHHRALGCVVYDHANPEHIRLYGRGYSDGDVVLQRYKPGELVEMHTQEEIDELKVAVDEVARNAEAATSRRVSVPDPSNPAATVDVLMGGEHLDGVRIVAEGGWPPVNAETRDSGTTLVIDIDAQRIVLDPTTGDPVRDSNGNFVREKYTLAELTDMVRNFSAGHEYTHSALLKQAGATESVTGDAEGTRRLADHVMADRKAATERGSDGVVRDVDYFSGLDAVRGDARARRLYNATGGQFGLLVAESAANSWQPSAGDPNVSIFGETRADFNQHVSQAAAQVAAANENRRLNRRDVMVLANLAEAAERAGDAAVAARIDGMIAAPTNAALLSDYREARHVSGLVHDNVRFKTP
ncbi:Uncharacterised protein [uncultured archaeon]|nr:Uncharacterised protein [uncultured archaeon]